MVGHEVQDQSDTPRRQRLPGGGKPGRSTQAVIDHIVPDAVRRPDDILGTPIGKSGLEIGPQGWVFQCDPDSGGAATPDPHQPHRIETQTGNLVPVPVRDGAQIDLFVFFDTD